MNNIYQDVNSKTIISDLKNQLIKLREELNETDERYPHIQRVIDAHWND